MRIGRGAGQGCGFIDDQPDKVKELLRLTAKFLHVSRSTAVVITEERVLAKVCGLSHG